MATQQTKPMKYALLTFLLLPFTLLAQEMQSAPFKFCNIIVLQHTDSTEAFKKVKMLFADNDFQIISSDVDTQTITGEKDTKKGPIRTTATLRGDKINLKSSFKWDVSISLYGATSEPSYDPLDFRGQKGSPIRIAWDVVDKIAHAYEGGKVFYSKK